MLRVNDENARNLFFLLDLCFVIEEKNIPSFLTLRIWIQRTDAIFVRPGMGYWRIVTDGQYRSRSGFF